MSSTDPSPMLLPDAGTTPSCKDAIKRFGKVHTPAPIVQFMLERLFKGDLLDLHICDPACGTGDFLVPIAEELCRRYASSGDDRLQNTLLNLTGYDIDPESVMACRKRLSDTSERLLGIRVPKCDWCILERDALAVCQEGAGQFDWVVGNPPYVRIPHLDASRRTHIKNGDWRYYYGASDLYIVFYELGLRLLKDRGDLLFIAPSGWMRNAAGTPMRKDIAENHGVVALYDFHGFQVFNGFQTYTSITHLRKSTPVSNPQTYRWEDGAFNDQTDLVNRGSKWAIVPAETQHHAGKSSRTLGDIADIRGGIQTMADRVFILEVVGESVDEIRVKGLTRSFLIEKDAVRPIVKASVMRNGRDPINRVAIYPYDDDGNLLPEATFADLYPHAYRWLAWHKRLLLARDKGTFPESKWYGYGRDGYMQKAFGRKIVTAVISKEPNFQVVDGDDTLFYSGYGIKLRNGGDLDELAAVLNCKAMAEHICHYSQPFSNGWYSYSKTYIQDFPVPDSFS